MRLRFKINDQTLQRIDHESIVSQSRNYIRCSFHFSREWDGLDKFVVFKNDNSDEYPLYMGNDSNTVECKIPPYTLTGEYFTIGVYADDYLSSNLVTIPLEESLSPHSKYPPNKDVYVQIFEELHMRFDDVTLEDKSLYFWSEGRLIQIVEVPFVNETQVQGWILDAINGFSVDSELDSESTNPIANKTVVEALEGKAESVHSHESEDIIDLGDALEGNTEEVLDTLTDLLNRM